MVGQREVSLLPRVYREASTPRSEEGNALVLAEWCFLAVSLWFMWNIICLSGIQRDGCRRKNDLLRKLAGDKNRPRNPNPRASRSG